MRKTSRKDLHGFVLTHIHSEGVWSLHIVSGNGSKTQPRKDLNVHSCMPKLSHTPPPKGFEDLRRVAAP